MRVPISVASSCTDLRILAGAATRAGLKRIHATWPQLHRWLLQHSVDVTAETIDLSLNEGVSLAGMDAATLTVQCDNDLDDQTDDAYMKMRIARKLKLKKVTLFGGSRDTATYDYLVAALLRLTTLADRLGLDVLLGNRRGTCLEQIDDMLRVIADVDATNLYIDLDAIEFHLACVNPCDAFLAFGPRISRLRLANVEGGELRIPAILRAVESTDCHCPLVLKLGDDDDAETRLAADVLFLESVGYATE